MKAMRAYEASQVPELHGVISLCALADSAKPRVGISELDIPNAFATGRSPNRAVVCVDSRDHGQADARGARGRARARSPTSPTATSWSWPSRRRHRGWHAHAGLADGALFGRRDKRAAFFFITLTISVIVYAVSFFLLRLLSQATASCAPTARAPT